MGRPAGKSGRSRVEFAQSVPRFNACPPGGLVHTAQSPQLRPLPMNLNPLRWLSRKAAETSTGSAIAAAQREQMALGPWTGTFQNFVARQVNPALYEATREALPIVDGALGMLVTLDGIVRVEGDDEALVAEIDAWMQSVTVNDAETGLQAFYESQSNEMLEQGFAIGEWTARKDGKGIERLRVADSKGVMFLRDGDALRTFYRAPAPKTPTESGLATVEALLRRTPGLTAAGLLEKDYREIDLRRVVYVVNRPEADNPYGTSLLRGLEVTTDVMLRIQTALGRTWTRWGDPVFHISYKTKNGKVTETELTRRKTVLAQELALALAGKERGNSTDFVTATGSLDEILVNAIGAASVALDPKEPLRHVTEQVCSRFGLPSWLLGVEGTVGAGQAERQSEMVLQASKTRWERRRPGLEAVVAAHLRLAGKTWKAGAWKLVQELPNLQDMMKIAQARFLEAQAAMVGGGDPDAAPRGIDNNLRGARSPRGKRTGSVRTKASDDEDGEGWAGDEADDMRRIERRGVRAALDRWWLFAGAVAAVLGFEAGRRVIRAIEDADWRFPTERMADLLVLEQRFVHDSSADDGALLGAVFSAWQVGAEAAAGSGADVAAAIADRREAIAAYLRVRGGELVRNATTRAWRERIFAVMASGALDGLRAGAVAKLLEQKFAAGNSDWQRLVVSEMNIARSGAKLDGYQRAGITHYDYVTMEDGRVSDICLALAAAGPYAIGAPGSPLPVRDSHPNCRCDVVSHVVPAAG